MAQEDLNAEIGTCLEVLRKGGLILYPSDTLWGIGCDATDEMAVKKLRALKGLPEGTPMVCLVGNDAMLERYVQQVPDLAWEIMDLATKPTTLVYDRPRGLAPGLIAGYQTIAIRVATDKFCRYLIGSFKKPVVSTCANLFGKPVPKSFEEIPEAILKGVDYVVNLQRDSRKATPSSIIKLGNDGTVKVIRE
ncbi:L-threonylcarbamoyladenylate synthase [Muriicola jejuensis]|uniref:L-threonylcarbamoyladenylate synthase n=1 Tax=Muriicola jejuensis TaxID=504488 RepID=A0A6P0UFT6_9FLAO|nr:L-threonylcarbamoyladenylate synthase [Muriicola jejuensis]NER10749.1 threonylcarbamoyl-AMP synthase [Muriicola jejuensis]SMP16477.1 L-threonylcarbamoyladenylate synthase [Muriicola jejuensis]